MGRRGLYSSGGSGGSWSRGLAADTGDAPGPQAPSPPDLVVLRQQSAVGSQQPGMSDLKWSPPQISAFLKVYRRYEELWNPALPEYSSRETRRIAFQGMMKELDESGLKTSESQLKQKIKSLRDTYRNELNRVKRSLADGAGGEGVHRPKLAWFTEADEIWRDVTQEKNPHPIFRHSIYGSGWFGGGCEAFLVKEEAEQQQGEPDSSSPLSRLHAESDPLASDPLTSEPHSEPKRPRLEPQPQQQHQQQVTEDQYQVFGLFVASELRNSSEPLRRQLKAKILQILLDSYA